MASTSRTRTRPPSPLFSLQGSKRRNLYLSVSADSSVRRTHLRRLNDVLHLCLGRGDMVRARRAWTVLNRCMEVDGRENWGLEALLVGVSEEEGVEKDEVAARKARRKYLKEMQGLNRKQSPAILLEYVLHLLADRLFSEALNELELYLPTTPYALDPTLHEYAGMTALMLAQEGVDSRRGEDDEDDDEESDGERQDEDEGATNAEEARNQKLKRYLASLSSSTYHGQAIAHFTRALALDPTSEVAQGYLHLLNVPIAATATQTQATASSP